MATISINGRLEQDLQDLATRCKLTVAELTERILEREIEQQNKTNGQVHQPKTANNANKKSPAAFVGLFSSKGDGKISQNYKQIIAAEIDKKYGFRKN